MSKVLRRDGTVSLKLIKPGWGSSGHYSAELLERDGPKVFTDQLHMYLNHPTRTEESERPERDVRDLAAVLVGNARWEANGPAGAGLYGEAQIFGGFKDVIEELAPHIGVSIRAFGKAKQGEAEGRKGNIIEQLTAAQSVDFVTVPGAGGQVLQLFESARGRAPEPGTKTTQEGRMTDDERREMQLLRETNARQEEELARIREGHTFVTATRYVKDVLTKRYGDVMPAKTIERLAEAQGKRPTTKDDGAMDYEAYAAQIHTAAKDELAYLAEIGIGSGKVKGMGGSGPFEVATDMKESQERLAEAFGRIGLHKDAAALAAAGRS